jgi:hypothetical protein
MSMVVSLVIPAGFAARLKQGGLEQLEGVPLVIVVSMRSAVRG